MDPAEVVGQFAASAALRKGHRPTHGSLQGRVCRESPAYAPSGLVHIRALTQCSASLHAGLNSYAASRLVISPSAWVVRAQSAVPAPPILFSGKCGTGLLEYRHHADNVVLLPTCTAGFPCPFVRTKRVNRPDRANGQPRAAEHSADCGRRFGLRRPGVLRANGDPDAAAR